MPDVARKIIRWLAVNEFPSAEEVDSVSRIAIGAATYDQCEFNRQSRFDCELSEDRAIQSMNL